MGGERPWQNLKPQKPNFLLLVAWQTCQHESSRAHVTIILIRITISTITSIIISIILIPIIIISIIIIIIPIIIISITIIRILPAIRSIIAIIAIAIISTAEFTVIISTQAHSSQPYMRSAVQLKDEQLCRIRLLQRTQEVAVNSGKIRDLGFSDGVVKFQKKVESCTLEFCGSSAILQV